MRPQDFPLGKRKTGWGVHFGLDVRDSLLAAHLPKIVAMDASFVVFYVGDALQAIKCARACWALGMLPIIRPKCKINGGIPNWEAFVQALNAEGIPAYIQAYNEWGDSREWNLGRKLIAYTLGKRQQAMRARAFGKSTAIGNLLAHSWFESVFALVAGFNREFAAQRWRSAAGRIATAGGYPMLQVMEELDVRAALSGLPAEVAARVVGAAHSYFSNHPINYPWDVVNQRDHPGSTIMDDDIGMLSFLEYGEWLKDSLGFYPPVFVTEGGPFYQQLEDNRYPRTDDQIHADMVVGTIEQFRTGVLANGAPLPDWLLGFGFWIWHDPDWDSWYEGTLGTRQLTIDRVTAIPAFTRKFSGEIPPPPPPPPTSAEQKSMLGMFIQSLGDLKPDAKSWVRRGKPRGLLSMDHNDDAWREILAESPKTKVIGRMADEGDINWEDPENAADAFFARLLPLMKKMRGLYWAWMGPNEPVAQNVARARNLSRFYVRLAEKAHAAGFRLIFGSFSEGNPSDLNLWKELLPGIRACDWLVAVHEYDAPAMDSSAPQSRCFRFVAMLRVIPAEDAARVQIFILECGIDWLVDHRDLGQPQERKGWKKSGDIGNYLSAEHNLGWYDRGLKKYDQALHGGAGIAFATPFAAAWDIESSYNLGDQDAYLQYISPGEPPELLTTSAIPPPPQAQAGWCPFAMPRPINSENFGVGRGGLKPFAVVAHVAVGSMIFETFNAHFAKPEDRRSAHFGVKRNGLLEQYLSIENTAYANGLIANPSWQDLLNPSINPNLYTIAIEHEGFPEQAWTPEMRATEIKLLRWIGEQTRIVYVARRTLIGHYQINGGKPNCPGPNYDYGGLASAANGTLPLTAVEEAVIHTARAQFELPIDPTHALMKAARLTTHYYPKSDEYLVTQGGADYVARTFTDGFTDWIFYCPVGRYAPSDIRWVAKH